MSLSEEIVEDIVDFYWKEIRNRLDGLEDMTIYISNFGTVYMRRKRLDISIERQKRMLARQYPKTYQKFAILSTNKEKMEKLIRLRELIDKENERLKQKRQARYAKTI